MNAIRKLAHRVRDFLVGPLVAQTRSTLQVPPATSQILLRLAYRQMVASGQTLPDLGEVGFKAFSQADEDGILLYLFSIIGTTNKTCVEICCGNGIECNTANLIINHGWSGLLADGNESLVKEGREFYAASRHTYVWPPTFVHAWITRSNVNQVMRENGFDGDVDLLSIDMDGVDYWIWDAIDTIRPRVVVAEYQDILGPERVVTVPYSEDFNARNYSMTRGMPNFCGASLPAFVKLARRRGYRLVGCNRYGYNAFFVLNTLGLGLIPEVPIGACFTHPKVNWGIKERFPLVRDLPWVEV